jgi:hypothetical protein
VNSTPRFADEIVRALHGGKILGLRAGTDHRFIGVWVVVVEGRAFVRSWSLKPRSWYRTFLVDPRGAITIDGREIAIRAIRTRSERLKDAVSAAYAAKYHTRASLKYVRGFARARLRATTTELVPVAAQADAGALRAPGTSRTRTGGRGDGR